MLIVGRHEGRGPEGSLATGLVLDDDGPIPAFGQAIGKKPSGNVDSAPGRKWHNDAHGLLWPLVGSETGVRDTSAAEDRKNQNRHLRKATH
jgi:hypothetical protein